MFAAVIERRSMGFWSPANEGKVVNRELKKLRPRDGKAALVLLIEDWLKGDAKSDQEMIDLKRMLPYTTHGHDLWYFRASVGRARFRLVFDLSTDQALALHAFKKTDPQASTLGFGVAGERQKLLDQMRRDDEKL